MLWCWENREKERKRKREREREGADKPAVRAGQWGSSLEERAFSLFYLTLRFGRESEKMSSVGIEPTTSRISIWRATYYTKTTHATHATHKYQ